MPPRDRRSDVVGAVESTAAADSVAPSIRLYLLVVSAVYAYTLIELYVKAPYDGLYRSGESGHGGSGSGENWSLTSRLWCCSDTALGVIAGAAFVTATKAPAANTKRAAFRFASGFAVGIALFTTLFVLFGASLTLGWSSVVYALLLSANTTVPYALRFSASPKFILSQLIGFRYVAPTRCNRRFGLSVFCGVM